MNKMNGFTDLHAHILPGVDDGAKSMDETIRMLRMANEEQITTIIATPHFIPGTRNASADQINSVLGQVQEEARRINNEMRILPGNEIFYSASVLDALNSKRAFTLAGSRYILIEFLPGEIYQNIFRGLGQLVRGGYLPILAHMERYRCLYKNEDYVSELVDMGCYIQMNCNSLIGGIRSPDVLYNRRLIKLGLVHFLGTDCHDDSIRIPRMRRAVNQLYKKCNEDMIHKILYENPYKVLQDNYL